MIQPVSVENQEMSKIQGKKKNSQSQKNIGPKAVKAIKAIKQIAGRGDYRPTQFQRVKGRGDYFGDLLGSLGQKAGNFLQGKFRDLTGFGDYRSHGPKKNSLANMVKSAASTEQQNQMGTGPSENPFTMGAMSVKFGGKAPRVQHREFIGSVLSPANPTEFSTTAYPIQPGLYGSNTLFPWGGSVFRNFEQYILHGAVIEYHSTSSNYSASSALGSVSMSTIYDANEQPLASLASVNNNEFTTSAAPSVSFYHPIECSPKDGATEVKYVRRSNTSASLGTDERFDDFGIFQISTSGLSAPAGTKIGEIWMSYDIELLKAVLPDLHAGTTAQFDSATTASMSTMWGVITPDPENSLPVVLTNNAGSASTAAVSVNMPPDYNGNYMLLYLALTSSGQNWVAGVENFVVDQIKADITPLNLFPTGVVGTKASTFQCSNGASGVAGNLAIGMFAFSTIARTAATNNFQAYWTTPGSAVAQRAQIFIIPLDNDITDEQGLLDRLSRQNPLAFRLAKLMNSYQHQLGQPDMSQALTVPASSTPSRADSSWEQEEIKDSTLEQSVHIDRKQLEALLGATPTSSSSSSRSLGGRRSALNQ